MITPIEHNTARNSGPCRHSAEASKEKARDLSASCKVKFIKMLCSNFCVEGLSVRYEIKKPFCVLAKMASNYNWRPHGDSNPGYRREKAMS